MRKREYNNFIHHPDLRVLNNISSKYIINITGNLPQEHDRSVARLSTRHHLCQSLPHHLLIKKLARGELTHGGGSANGRNYARLTRYAKVKR
jgi:hypothetical protein